jgi:hypothetical protein
VSDRVRKDGIVMHHIVTDNPETQRDDHWWQAERDGTKSEWFRSKGGKTGYQRALDDLTVAVMVGRVLCKL